MPRDVSPTQRAVIGPKPTGMRQTFMDLLQSIGDWQRDNPVGALTTFFGPDLGAYMDRLREEGEFEDRIRGLSKEEIRAQILSGQLSPPQILGVAPLPRPIASLAKKRHLETLYQQAYQKGVPEKLSKELDKLEEVRRLSGRELGDPIIKEEIRRAQEIGIVPGKGLSGVYTEPTAQELFTNKMLALRGRSKARFSPPDRTPAAQPAVVLSGLPMPTPPKKLVAVLDNQYPLTPEQLEYFAENIKKAQGYRWRVGTGETSRVVANTVSPKRVSMYKVGQTQEYWGSKQPPMIRDPKTATGQAPRGVKVVDPKTPPIARITQKQGGDVQKQKSFTAALNLVDQLQIPYTAQSQKAMQAQELLKILGPDLSSPAGIILTGGQSSIPQDILEYIAKQTGAVIKPMRVLKSTAEPGLTFSLQKVTSGGPVPADLGSLVGTRGSDSALLRKK